MINTFPLLLPFTIPIEMLSLLITYSPYSIKYDNSERQCEIKHKAH